MREWVRTVLSSALLGLVGIMLIACADAGVSPWPVSTPEKQSMAPTTTQTMSPPVVAAVATPEPLIPTAAPAQTLAVIATATSARATLPITEPVNLPTLPIEATPQGISTRVAPAVTSIPSTVKPTSLRSRLGVGVAPNVTDWTFDETVAQRLGMGWYLDWGVQTKPVQTNGLEFAQMIRVHGTGYSPDRAEIANALAANPGSLWLIGNEPDVRWQDNTSPEDYARRFHELVVFIKSLDPTAQVAIGGVSQVTPLRLSYLERVLAAYEEEFGEPMPVDVWNIHTFILREERDSWGVSIPPGFDDVQQGILWEIEDHDDLDLLHQQVVDFRRWMVDHGQRNKPLIVTEYGILMPEEYGFPPESVADFMRRSFDLLLITSDAETGYPADGNRLVQRFLWYSLSDTNYPTGNLVDPVTGALTPLGQAFAEYANGLNEAP